MIEHTLFPRRLTQQWRPRKKQNLAQSSRGDEDDAQTSNTRIAQRKRTIPHSTMKNKRNIIECRNNTRQGAPCTGKQMCVLRTSVTLVMLLVPDSQGRNVESPILSLCIGAMLDQTTSSGMLNPTHSLTPRSGLC